MRFQPTITFEQFRKAALAEYDARKDDGACFQREVLPQISDAGIDHEKTKVGYVISFNRYFYVFKCVSDRILMLEGLPE